MLIAQGNSNSLEEAQTILGVSSPLPLYFPAYRAAATMMGGSILRVNTWLGRKYTKYTVI